MVKSAAPPRRTSHDDEPVHGRWLCNVVKGCDEFAVIQASVDCDGCDDAVAELERNRDAVRARIESLGARVESIRAVCEAEDRAPSPDERLDLHTLASELSDCGAVHHALAAAAAAVSADHTHPMFACEKHAARLERKGG